jgi:CheY-like chemotaxis protein
VDLLLTDITLPGGIDGRELADEIKAVYPGVRVLFVSGYDRNGGPPDEAFLAKPYSRGQLAQSVRAVLDDKS